MKILVVILAILAVVIPLATWVSSPYLPAAGKLPPALRGGSSYSASRIPFKRERVGPLPHGLPLISNVQIVDLDGDGRTEVMVCDAAQNAVYKYERASGGEWIEATIAADLSAPAHATVVDLDRDGDLDIVVSVLGNLAPDDGVIGRVVWLENVGGRYEAKTILDNVRRVADVQPADFDGDGDVDLAVAVFGYNRGEVLWLEQEEGEFVEHQLLSRPGTIHVPVADYDGDGDADIAAIVSQDEEELWAFENLGMGKFKRRLLHRFFNFDIGSAGLVHADLDRDGDSDLILPLGDNLEENDAYPQPYHGCIWFENRGGWQFVPHRISELGGTYAADAGDVDGDGDLDVVLVSMANDWYATGNASIVWLENDGSQNFQTWQIDSNPTHLVTVACGDLNNDGIPDIVAGGLHIRAPYNRIGRVTAWLSGAEGKP